MPRNPTLPDVLLAAALFDAGLAPLGVIRIGADTYIGGDDGVPWEPWRCIADVWHLVLRYRIHLVLWATHPRVVCGPQARRGTAHPLCGMSEEAKNDEDLVAAIGRLSLRLRQTELTQETPDEPPRP